MLGHALLAMAVLIPMDQTVQVTRGTKLDVNNFAGDVIVKVWDRDAVRVEVNHSDREAVDLKQADQSVTIRSRSLRGGPPRSLDYTITVPKWMPINVSGTYADVTLDGVGGDVNVETTRGDIKVNGGSGFVSLKSVQGEISLAKANGRVEIRAVNEGIRLADINADLSAETTNGSIILDRIESSNVDLYTVNGNISYDGPIKDKGLYRLTTHNGMIALAVPERVNAALTVRTYNGSFRSTFPIKQDDQNPRKRFTVTLGNGSAHLELESFAGTIALRRPGEPRPEVERRRSRERDNRNNDHHDNQVERAVHDALMAVEHDMPEIVSSIDAKLPEVLASAQDAASSALAEVQASLPDIIDAAREALRTMPFPVPHPEVRPLPRPK
jgi:DUF4097 and DUF4098 domain-containing protein YvlB